MYLYTYLHDFKRLNLDTHADNAGDRHITCKSDSNSQKRSKKTVLEGGEQKYDKNLSAFNCWKFQESSCPPRLWWTIFVTFNLNLYTIDRNAYSTWEISTAPSIGVWELFVFWTRNACNIISDINYHRCTNGNIHVSHYLNYVLCGVIYVIMLTWNLTIPSDPLLKRANSLTKAAKSRSPSVWLCPDTYQGILTHNSRANTYIIQIAKRPLFFILHTSRKTSWQNLVFTLTTGNTSQLSSLLAFHKPFSKF